MKQRTRADRWKLREAETGNREEDNKYAAEHQSTTTRFRYRSSHHQGGRIRLAPRSIEWRLRNDAQSSEINLRARRAGLAP
jgi:hypothetical protein